MEDVNASRKLTTFFLTIAISIAAALIAYPIAFSSSAFASVEKDMNPGIVEYVRSSVEATVRFASNGAGGKIERIHFPDGSSALIETCPMTAEQQSEFGHVKCDLITPDEFRTLGYVQVGLANYTWSDDSVLDFSAISQMNNLHIEEGIYKDSEGFVACYSRTNDMYEKIETPLGPGKIYDFGGDWYTIGILLAS